MRYKTLIITILVFFQALVTAQEAVRKLTLDECRKLALRQNRAAAIAAKTEERTFYESKSYFANFLPRFTLSGSYLFSNAGLKKTLTGAYLPTFVPDAATGELQPNLLTLPDGAPVTDLAGNPVFREYAYFPDMTLDLKMNGIYFAGLRAEQPLYMGGKILTAYRMSLTGKDIAALNSELTRDEIIVKTDEAYWLHVKALETLKVAKAFRSVVDELFNNVENARLSGLKSRNDVLKVQVQLNKAKLQIQQAENAITLSRMNLCQVIGLPIDSIILIVSLQERLSVPTSPLQTVSLQGKLSVSTRPEYAILEKQVELKSQQIKLVRSDFLPNIGIGANYGYMRGLELNGSPLIDRASFTALLTVSVPVFHWGEGLNKLRAARAEKESMELQRAELNEKMELEALQAQQKLNEAALEVNMTATALEQADENMRESRDRYDAGMETLADCLEAQTLRQQAALAHIEAIIALHLAQTHFRKAAGCL